MADATISTSEPGLDSGKQAPDPKFVYHFVDPNGQSRSRGSTPNWANYINGRDDKPRNQRASDNGEIKADKSELKADVKALIASIDIAIERQLDSGRGNTRTQIYEMARSEASKLLNALDSDGSSHALDALRESEYAIKSFFQQEADKTKRATGDPDDDDDPANLWKRPKSLMTQEEVNKKVEADPYMQELERRRVVVADLQVQNEAMAVDIKTSADDGKHDLKAAITAAAVIYGGGDLQEYLKNKKVEMLATDQSPGSGATVDQRIALIEEEGRKIEASMRKGRAETQASIADAAVRIVQLHLGEHANEYAEHLTKTKATITSCHCGSEELDEKANKLQAHVQGTMEELTSSLRDMRDKAQSGGDSTPVTAADLEALKKDMNIDKIFVLWQEKGDDGAELLRAHDAIYRSASEKIGSAEQQLTGLLKGNSSKGADEVAIILGVPKDNVLSDVGSLHEQIIAGQIDKINDSWKKGWFQQKQDISPPLFPA